MKVLWSFGIILRGVTSNVPATRGQYLTIDAMHARHDTAQLILGRGADYVMTVRASMPGCAGSSGSCRGLVSPPSRP
jgi:hypothetical protein